MSKVEENMPKSRDGSADYTQLRDKAEAQLKAGTTPRTTNWTLGVDALRMLHRLSSSPDTAQDALKLLHELQVHQVELDVQHEEIMANEHAVAEDLSRYQALFDHAPVGYFLLDHAGTVVAGNLAGAEQFGVDRESLGGLRIETLLTPELRPQLREFLQRVVQSRSRGACTLQAQPDTNAAACLQFVASILPGSECILLTCNEVSTAG